MQRPGPLRELSSEQLVQQQAIAHSSSFKGVKNNKRQLSPGAPALFSPAKRRILTEEGVFSPEKTHKTPLPSFVGSLGSPARFSKVLAGPASPARILDFGLPKRIAGDPQKRPSLSHTSTSASRPRHTSSSSSSGSLAPSLELKGKSTRSTRSSSISAFRSDEQDEEAIINTCYCVSCTAGPIYVPRQQPRQSDPSSEHYPGFKVYQDPHEVVWPVPNGDDCWKDVKVEPDTHKENLPLHRKVRKGTVSTSGTGLKTSKNTFSFPPDTIKRDAKAKYTPGSSGIIASLSSMSIPSQRTPTQHSTTLKRREQQLLKNEMDIDVERGD